MVLIRSIVIEEYLCALYRDIGKYESDNFVTCKLGEAQNRHCLL